MEELQKQLEQLNIPFTRIEPIRSKDGVTVARVFSEGSHILKYFEKKEYAREIENYRILAALGVPTLKVTAATDCAILLEDAVVSPVFRLGEEEDLNDPQIAVQLAKWYKTLHERGRDFVKRCGAELYAETDCITPENLEFIKSAAKIEHCSFWRLMEENFSLLKRKMDALNDTLTYNDFYYTNLIAAKDKSSAFMFDYNLLGRGYSYSDLRNVCWSLGEEAKQAFLDEYGSFDPAEKAADEVISPIVTLYSACRRSSFPDWGNEALDMLKNGFEQRLADFLGDLP